MAIHFDVHPIPLSVHLAFDKTGALYVIVLGSLYSWQ
jgi:hypothetical protein